MSSNDVEEVQKTAENVEEKGKKQLNLFKPIGIRNPAYWQCMSYIASDDACEDAENTFDIFETTGQEQQRQQRRDSADKSRDMEMVKVQAKQEALSYLMAVETVATGRIKLSKLDPLDWWQENKTKYPHIAVLARKWLSVPATSTPSKRVFSICGIVNTAKRSKMNGKSIENQVLIHNNQSVLS